MVRFAAFLLVFAAAAFGQPQRAADWAFTPDPNLPNVLILGDSISIGYTLEVRSLLRGKANVYRPMSPGGKPANCRSTGIGLQELPKWLAGARWAAIHFNWGLHDLCYRKPDAKAPDNRDKVNGRIEVPLPVYKENLGKLTALLAKTGARSIWAATTRVPEGEPGRFAGDEVKYNDVAREIVRRHGAAIDDLYTLTAAFPPDLWLGPGNVHYKPEGYARLAVQVAASIERALAGR